MPEKEAVPKEKKEDVFAKEEEVEAEVLKKEPSEMMADGSLEEPAVVNIE